ncbi:60S ribosomal protein L6 [Dionaea muscipula]
MYHRRGLSAIKKQNDGAFPDHEGKPSSNKRKHKPTRLRDSITPGTVLILLAGRFMGKRVVFLKQLPSGLLLVTGPYRINGVPLRRVSQAYVIATSTKVDISGVNVKKFEDKYFSKKSDKKKNKKDANEFFDAEKPEKQKFPQEKKDDQKTVDVALIKLIESVPNLKAYLGARFSLKDGMKPHELVF